MLIKRPTVLLIWGYHRKGWLHGLLPIEKYFNFVFLFFFEKDESEINYTSSKTIYWNQFSSAQDLLKKIEPEKVVFMGLTGINSIALNIVAKNNKIPTYIIQHGQFHEYKDYIEAAKTERLLRENEEEGIESPKFFVDYRQLLKFFLKSVVLVKPSSILWVLRFYFLKRKYTEIEALTKLKSNDRNADFYIVYTKKNSELFKIRDGILESQMIEVGNPEMDEFLTKKLVRRNHVNPYYLLVAQPWVEVKEFNSKGYGITSKMCNNFYLKINKFAQDKGAKLIIKLHPYSYSSSFYVKHSNISYIREHNDLPRLIKESIGVFGYSSSLMIPAIYFKKCCLFKVLKSSSFQDKIQEIGIATVLDYYSFELSDLEMTPYPPSQKMKKAFVDEFLSYEDGNTAERIKNILINN